MIPKFNMKFFLKTYKIFLSISVTCCLLFSCGGLDTYDDVDRTVLIYFAANNDLTSFAKSNLDTLKTGYIPDYFDPVDAGKVLLVYYHNSRDLLPDKTERPPRLLRISKDRHGNVNEEILQEYDKNQNSGDISTLKEVLEYANRLFPSEDNGLFLWSHATGWLPKGFYSGPIGTSIGKDGKMRQVRLPQVVDPAAHRVKSFGEDGGNEMDIRDLAKALPVKYSFIVFDACYMGGVEVVYELKDKADYIISSSAEVLAASFPYHKVMTHIYKNAEPNLIKVCEEYVNFYSTQPKLSDRSATVSLVQTSRLGELAAASAVIFNKDRGNVGSLNMSNVQRYFRYNKHWFYDMDDYVKKISSDLNNDRRFSSAMESAVIYKGSTPNFFFNGTSFEGNGFPITHFSGLSTYVPNPTNSYLERYYKTLSWNIDAQMIK